MSKIMLLSGDLQSNRKRRYNRTMAYSKKFDQRIMVRFKDETLARIQSQLQGREDRSEYIREAVEVLAAIRDGNTWSDLTGILIASEKPDEFIAKAVKKAIKRRLANLDDPD